YIPQHYYSRSCLDPSFFFFHATSTLDTYPFSLPDALPISRGSRCGWRSATSRISERSSGRRNAASPPLSAVPPDASSRARSSRTGSRPSPSSPPPTPTGSTPTCEHPAYTDQLTGPGGFLPGSPTSLCWSILTSNGRDPMCLEALGLHCSVAERITRGGRSRTTGHRV